MLVLEQEAAHDPGFPSGSGNVAAVLRPAGLPAASAEEAKLWLELETAQSEYFSLVAVQTALLCEQQPAWAALRRGTSMVRAYAARRESFQRYRTAMRALLDFLERAAVGVAIVAHHNLISREH